VPELPVRAGPDQLPPEHIGPLPDFRLNRGITSYSVGRLPQQLVSIGRYFRMCRGPCRVLCGRFDLRLRHGLGPLKQCRCGLSLSLGHAAVAEKNSGTGESSGAKGCQRGGGRQSGQGVLHASGFDGFAKETRYNAPS
jgi:hypothetical protein